MASIPPSYMLPQIAARSRFPARVNSRNQANVRSTSAGAEPTQPPPSPQRRRRCLRCKKLYLDEDNSPTACSFHGHINGEKGLFALSPPHQGIDGDWTDRSGVIVYKWNEINDRPNTGRRNWKKRWSCCSEFDENAPACRQGWHVSYDDGFTLH